MKILLVLLLLLLLLLIGIGLNSYAGVINYSPSGGTLEDVQLSKSAEYKSINLNSKEAQLITKKVGIANIRIMVSERFINDSLSLKAVKLTFLRTIDSDSMRSGISDYLNENVSEEDRYKNGIDIQKALDIISKEDTIFVDKTISIVGDVQNGQIIYENTSGTIFVLDVQNKGFINNIFGMWGI